MKKIFFVLCILHCVVSGIQAERYNFNADWRFALGKEMKGSSSKTDDSSWEVVTLPHAFNATEAFSRNCAELSDTVMWYRKHFVLPASAKGKKIIVEFEGVRFGARVFINGKELGWHENGVMAFGMDLTPYIKYNSENVLSLRVDNDWKYKEHLKFPRAKDGKEVRSGYQWNDKNFYCNYGGINKNVWLHILNPVYQTLPLYSNLGTTGVYVYASDMDVPSATATIHAEAQVINSSATAQNISYRVRLLDNDGKEVASWDGESRNIAAGDTVLFSAEKRLSGLHFWSWGYGYLYTVVSELVSNGKVIDSQRIETGFRKTAFHDGIVYLNARAIQMKGFAQRSTNEWPAVGISLPAWMSDYSNSLILGCNGNFVRWMHVTPSKQDIRSFDRLGLMMAMPAGDAEKDVDDRRWDHRVMLMRDAIIYNRNNPSIIFYEGGNNQISEEHMAELKAVRDLYDPHGGRAIGSRNMLDSKVAEYGGEMLY
ncbi:MAG: beta-galactosidase, partial [Paludibacteraceae bacterium]|nr:beta-galactosidase [Paludibacteraceae bacterium]